ncbi:RIO1-domain-containing protein [Eremomyces bilateralis CBS 781.70]|uniref:Serine/threonine-protein kinase RIO1 n=1 Tax=Eremomyces bilateralis CBS 781.70 TaxID=1392243 RepID=A0A6G1FUI5_9PEZI|nr:RIO1-domain-containing protein [Eremomyces bilateralis CBS 781.70]KAF1809352.1 RIO1-domain-containing protein [Eremomyces bilateralis CBS 781.70]
MADPSPAAALQPPHQYAPNEGYQDLDARADTIQDRLLDPSVDEEEEDYDYDSEPEITAEDLSSTDPADFTKAYNRPSANPQRPTANLNDHISSLSHLSPKLNVNHLYNNLRAAHTGADRADRATVEQALDPRTRMILLQLINRGIVSEINGCVSTGKEANVYHAVLYPSGSDGASEPQPIHRAIKVYKTAILVFKDRERYVTGDFRLQKSHPKKNHRAMVRLWAEKELRNLKRLIAGGVPAPDPIMLKSHVLVMSFVGNSRGWPAPRLKDVDWASEGIEDIGTTLRRLYMDLFSYVRILWGSCKLVHADLSEYNLLYFDGKLWVIDVSQSVEMNHPKSLEFLRMDLKNVTSYFQRNGVDTLSEKRVFEWVTKPGGTTKMDAMKDELEAQFAVRDALREKGEDDEDDEVWRQQFIPQNLEQVFDVERDAEKVGHGEGSDLVYRNLLADDAEGGVPLPRGNGEKGPSEGEEDSDEEGSERSWFEDEEKQPRGKRFVDKDEKRAHKHQVKEEKREKRKTKIPKDVKKRIVNRSSKGKK